MTTTVLPRSVCTDHPRYVAGCAGCREATAARKRIKNRLVAYGRWEGATSATACREHIAALVAAGMSQKVIAAKAEVSRNVIQNVLAGRQSSVRPGTERKILAVVAALPPYASVNSLGAQRRLRALMAAGWDAEALAPLLDTSVAQVRRWRWRVQSTMRYDTHLKIAAVYRAIGDHPGPSEAARRHARYLGYPAPIHWDDDGDLDAPKDRPKGAQAFRRVSA